MKITLNVDQV